MSVMRRNDEGGNHLLGLRTENIDACLLETGCLDIFFHEDDSEFVGNNFE